jgi:hypothetical protein
MPRSRAITATPTLVEPCETVAEKISCARTHIGAMKKSDEWASAPRVQARAAEWGQVNDELDVQHQRVADLEKELEAARNQEAILARRWATGARGTLTAVDGHCDGNADKVRSFGCGVRTWTPREPEGVPEGLQAKRSKISRTAEVTWTTKRGEHRTFEVQYATDPEDPATYSKPKVVSGGTFALGDRTPGETLHFRVRAIDAKLPTGYSAWTAWVPAMVST